MDNETMTFLAVAFYMLCALPVAVAGLLMLAGAVDQKRMAANVRKFKAEGGPK